MERPIRRAAVLAFAAIALLIGGCEVRSFEIWIPDFDSSQVRGVWIYQQATTGVFEKAGQLVFTDPFYKNGVEMLSYTADGLVDENGNQIHLETKVVRSPQNPDQVTLRIWIPCEPPAAIRVTTYNAVDESPLSGEVLYLFRDSPSMGTNATAS
jgi:hypothetical protein